MATTKIDLGVQAQDATLTNAKIASDQITNVKVNSAAAIAFSKLAALADGNLLIGSGSNVATSVSTSGDITLSNAGVFAIASGVVINADVKSDAAIDYSKLASLSSANLLIGSAGAVATSVSVTGDVTISNAGVTAIGATKVTNAMLGGSIADGKLASSYIYAGGSRSLTADWDAGDSGTYKITGLANGTAASDAINKAQLDGAINGLSWKAPVEAATTGAITLENEQTVDTVALVAGDRCLVKNQGSPEDDGIYVVVDAGAWTRAADMDVAAEANGAAVFILSGSANINRGYTQQANIVTLGTTEMDWVQFSVAGGDADTLDTLDSIQFLRSDADDSVTGNKTLTISSGSSLDVASGGSFKLAGVAITSTAAELNIMDGVTATYSELNILDGVTADAGELNLLDGVTATTAELNIMDGVTATYSELNLLDGVTATTAELNILDGVTATYAELNILDGVTADAGELNLLDGATVTTAELNALGTIVTREVPTGDFDGADFTYILANSPSPAGSESVFVNGILQDEGASDDYTIAGATITFATAPQADDKVLVNYRY